MEKEQWSQRIDKCKTTLQMLLDIAKQCSAQTEHEACEQLIQSLEAENPESGQEFEPEKQIYENKINHIAAGLLLNVLEPRLIIAVMDGEDMAEKMKLLNPRLSSTRKRLEDQLLEERQKLERLIVKCVMHLEAGYHIMIRKIREDLMAFEEEGLPVKMEQALERVIARQAYACLLEREADIEEMEHEILLFSRELTQTTAKCRKDIIEIMDYPLFQMIAQKTEQALEMIDYAPTFGNLQQMQQKLEDSMQYAKNAAYLQWEDDSFAMDVLGALPKIDVEPELTQWQESGCESLEPLLRNLGKKVNQVFQRQAGAAKKSYNIFLKKHMNAVLQELQIVATGYLKALQEQLCEAMVTRRAQKSVDREELEHLLEMRNHIVHQCANLLEEKEN